MKNFLLFFICCTAPLWAVKVDHSAARFDNHKRKQQLEVFDFGGLFPQLEHIDIDGRRKKCAELQLTGVYPLLKTIEYDGTFGMLDAFLTGEFPQLNQVNLSVTSAQLKIDLRGNWRQDCRINISGTSADVTISLPENVGVRVHTKTSPQGKVIAPGLQKKGFLKFFHRTYLNDQVDTADVVLDLHVELTNGRLVLQ